MNVWKRWNSLDLILRIVIGLMVGIVLALSLGDKFPVIDTIVTLCASLFVGALKAVAPLLVFFLIISSIATQKAGKTAPGMSTFIIMSFCGMMIASLMGVVASFLFPTTLALDIGNAADAAAPAELKTVLVNVLMKAVDNPVNALVTANYIGLLTWALLLGSILQKTASDATKEVIGEVSGAITRVVKMVISFAPFGIMGLVFQSINTSGLATLLGYGRLIIVLVSVMLITVLVVEPLMAFIVMRRNPYPLVFKALRESGLTAFFTRSSAANIPVNMALAERLNLNKDLYSVAIPLGANINMSGAAVTISVMAMAAAHTVGVEVSFPTAVVLCILATLSATGASGVAGGSLLLIPLACSLFGIDNNIAMQVVGVGFIIGVVQDSCETALNSHSDLVYLGAIEGKQLAKEGKILNVKV